MTETTDPPKRAFGRKSRKYAEFEHLLPEDLRMESILQLPDAPKKGERTSPGPIYLGACRRRGAALRKLNPEIRMGRPRTKFSREEIEEDAMKRMMPKALQVLEEQLDSHDPRVRQSAAIKVVEYNKGKPTQTVQAEVQNVTSIVYESAAWRPQGGGELEGVQVPFAELIAGDEEEQPEDDVA